MSNSTRAAQPVSPPPLNDIDVGLAPAGRRADTVRAARRQPLRSFALNRSSPSQPRTLPPGRGERLCAVAGHFGELLQGRLGPEGPVALVTLPAPVLRVVARFAPPGPFRVHRGAEPVLTRRRAAALYRLVTGEVPRGRLVMRADMPAGGGAGSSTAALLAAARAFVAGRGLPVPDSARLARICHQLEGATDPLMYAEPGRLLWAPRDACVLGTLPPLPALEIVGGFFGPGRATDPADGDFADISDLVEQWPAAAARGDAARLAALATESARRNARHRGGDTLAELLAAAERFGALGIVAAHTGSARGLIFAPGGGAPELAAAGLAAIGGRAVCRFRLAAGWAAG